MSNRLNNIRNFSIIAHIDHGKSTLADRMLEVTHTIEKRKMKDQVLDNMELERERGITIKMRPVRMNLTRGDETFVLNLIDTPGHIDFSYEVSRALTAVEGAILLVDATQGVQAQTLTTLKTAQELGLVIIPVVSKIDSPLARVDEVSEELAKLLAVSKDTVLRVSGKTGEGVLELLEKLVDRVPPPQIEIQNNFRSLVFDFSYSNHRGVIVFIRVTDGEVRKNDTLVFRASNSSFVAHEVGIFTPEEKSVDVLKAGEIGYIVTGIKEPGVAAVGDTVSIKGSPLPPLSGYMEPRPVVWASIYPESQDDFVLLRQSLERLRLSDSSLSFEEEVSGVIGRGFRCGFLGMLHMEIITERLRREFTLEIIVTAPSITYEVILKNNKREIVYSPHLFPDEGNILEIHEPWVLVKIITPSDYMGELSQLLYNHEAELVDTDNFSEDRISLVFHMPLRELMRNFFDEVKSVTSGYASLSYEIGELRVADVTKLEILVADEPVPAFTRIVARRLAQEESEKLVEKLYTVLPRQQFITKIQGKALGRILSSKTLSALKKDVTGHLYGGDITRKRKLWEKQKKGKKKLKEQGKVNIPHDVFLKMIK
ncbi:MAG: elongation factor 4 [Candidatus Zambryskibacteria bacterium CG10_big_fil_rev_8_21_14_0_10_42_12]|uniref:Elongation factor 4 n=1 Tax=Candidatus Zambryskibacteria bacterium CG10_big_fil_rev_8_21_14_0_10_42_12 TaxID=1975115 RepID=A0A2H0QV86_9BACT|nr:MAG: elongation factor 4 [Candidatus Zambryskibacteria bacterium CG10_big_fil_rev_8_21_14_0_10_42_12]